MDRIVLMYPTLGTSPDGTEKNGGSSFKVMTVAAVAPEVLTSFLVDMSQPAIATEPAHGSSPPRTACFHTNATGARLDLAALLEWCADLAPLGLHTRLGRALDRAIDELSRGSEHGASQVRTSQNCEVSV